MASESRAEAADDPDWLLPSSLTVAGLGTVLLVWASVAATTLGAGIAQGET